MFGDSAFERNDRAEEYAGIVEIFVIAAVGGLGALLRFGTLSPTAGRWWGGLTWSVAIADVVYQFNRLLEERYEWGDFEAGPYVFAASAIAMFLSAFSE